MTAARLRVALIGWGTVGSALGQLIAEGPLPIELACVAVRDPSRRRRVPIPRDLRVVEPAAALDAADTLVELAGGTDGPLEWARAALGSGRAYVTANKALLARHGGELAALAEDRGGALLGSASVGGGVPMIELVEHLARTARIGRLQGVLNATSTYILSAMSAGRRYDVALAEAQRAGYAEADPSADVDGHDAADKLAILASVAWGRWRDAREVERVGIVGLTVAAGQVLRLVAEATEDRMGVRPMQLDPQSQLAHASGIENVVEVEVQGMNTFRISGPGAGGAVTAGAVYADLARLATGERPVLFGGGR